MSTWQPPSSFHHQPTSYPSYQSPSNQQNQYRPVVGVIPHFDTHPGGPTASEQERALYEQEKQRERLAVVNQPHRTFPVVTPKPKPTHDYPTGSYLRYVRDPTWQQPPRVSSPVPRPDRLKEVMNRFAGDIDAEKVVHLQYNSPLNVYSRESIAETLAPQNLNKPVHSNSNNLHAAPPTHHHHLDPMVTRLSVSPIPSVGSGHSLRPSTPITDIRKSPTWQLIQEQESGKTYGPAKERVNSPVGATLHVSSIDGHESPAQSTSFKHLMTALVDHPAY
ncbi:uncharacterized protein LOC107369229 isoform X1 [Tetranychus urticae]|uniref:Zasp-like motif domain-containing protein n=1 Tax=Tetranychus urticae TaxID=32264 RepID=T1JSC6_TETUR|nr:uncharacterized protein LOC107369229 isoform X1 [Tetranychus urticae]XP_015792653.1 uncharacterized protein LOC107369229 isoform X1 [Tetranychus urticae]